MIELKICRNKLAIVSGDSAISSAKLHRIGVAKLQRSAVLFEAKNGPRGGAFTLRSSLHAGLRSATTPVSRLLLSCEQTFSAARVRSLTGVEIHHSCPPGSRIVESRNSDLKRRFSLPRLYE